MKPRLPNPTELAVIKAFLGESTGLHVDGVQFNRPASGLWMRVDYRDLKGFSHNKQLTAPDTDDFSELVVEMSNWLQYSEQDAVAAPSWQ